MHLPFTATRLRVFHKPTAWETKEVRRWIVSLGAAEHEFDVSGGQHEFRWWLWVATLENTYGSVVGAGISNATVRTNGNSWAEFEFGRCDGSSCRAT